MCEFADARTVNSHMRIGMTCEISRCCARDKREYGWRIYTVRGSYYNFLVTQIHDQQIIAIQTSK